MPRSTKPPVMLVPLATRPEPPRKNGRPKKLLMPPIPQEVLTGFSSLEREHYDFFLAAIEHDYPALTLSDRILLHMAALEYIQMLRVQAYSLTSGDLLSASKQDPGARLARWLDMMAATRKQRPRSETDTERDAMTAALRQLSS